MAIYRLSADIVRRSAGRTVTAAAAYRAGELIEDARTGLAFDYRRRRCVAHAEILAPANAPAWIFDRARLWNAVEAVEKRKDAQLARDIELALPHELTPAQRIELVRGFVAAAFVSEGMVADVAIHEPTRRDADARNHHAHVLLTMRALTGDGFGPKARAWNDSAKLEAWRELWAAHVNRALEQAGEAARIDHRSLEAQGIAREPQLTLGRAVIEMEARGIATDRGDQAREIDAVNAALAEIGRADAYQRASVTAQTKAGGLRALFARAARQVAKAVQWRQAAALTVRRMTRIGSTSWAGAVDRRRTGQLLQFVR